MCLRLLSFFLVCVFAIQVQAGTNSLVTTNHGPTSNILRSIVNTIYEGHNNNTDHTMDELTYSYSEFIRDFIYEPYCNDNRLTGLESACKSFQDEEYDKIKLDLWSAKYHFNKAEFGPRFTSYNFVRTLPLKENFLCKITLQVSFDLKTKHLVNREYWAQCD